jgi:hypothetical protein
VARDQGPDVVLNPQQMNILIPTVSPESVEALVFDLGGVLLDVQLRLPPVRVQLLLVRLSRRHIHGQLLLR